MLSANITTVWNRLCGRRSETRLDTLPTDILIDGIFARLDLKDIMTLRVVRDIDGNIFIVIAQL